MKYSFEIIILDIKKMTTNSAENSTNPATTTKMASIGMHSDIPQHIVVSGQPRSLAHLQFLLYPFLVVLDLNI